MVLILSAIFYLILLSQRIFHWWQTCILQNPELLLTHHGLSIFDCVIDLIKGLLQEGADRAQLLLKSVGTMMLTTSLEVPNTL